MGSKGVVFARYVDEHRARCLAIFDANCPTSFAPNERDEYAAFLRTAPDGYEVCLVDGHIAGAFGLVPTPRPDGAARMRLNWIMIDPEVQGRGVGRAMMERVTTRAREAAQGAGLDLDIAASHVSAPFFARFGARETRRTEDGWGPGMHRIDMVLRV